MKNKKHTLSVLDFEALSLQFAIAGNRIDLSSITAMKVGLAIIALEAPMKVFNESRKKLMESHGGQDNGRAGFVFKGAEAVAQKDAAFKELEPLQNETITVSIPEFEVKDFPSYSPEELKEESCPGNMTPLFWAAMSKILTLK